jgi:hypothetical protein
MTIDTNQNVTATGTVAMASSFKRNRIINGNMLIDQRNAGAIQSYGSTGSTYCLDRFFLGNSQTSKVTSQQNAGSVTPPAGLQNYLGVTVVATATVGSTDTFYISQAIEGYNLYDLAWGTASAKSITFSFWVYSSVTGTYGGSVINSGAISPRRTYCFSYSISSANTWTYVTVTIPGDTSGTWYQNNSGVGMYVVLAYGVGSTNSTTANSFQNSSAISVTGAQSIMGTLGATFYTTGWQLEVGTVATPYEMQIYSDQLAQCQRYYVQLNASTNFTSWGTGLINASNAAQGCVVRLPVSMRTTPTTTYSNVRLYCPAGTAAVISSITGSYNGLESLGFDCSFSTSVMTTGQPATIQANNTTSSYIAASAEL